MVNFGVNLGVGAVRVCPHGSGLCFSRSCNWLDNGECILCGRWRGNPEGRMMPRVVKRDFSGFSFVCRGKHWRGVLR
jgi:hypothetical protein